MIVVVAEYQRSRTKLMNTVTLWRFAQIATTAHQNVIVLARQFHYGIKYITVRYPHMNLKLPKR
jgi:hypothetical protein